MNKTVKLTGRMRWRGRLGMVKKRLDRLGKNDINNSRKLYF